ncbi:MAG: HAD-IIIA family hydrolase [Nanoarchaeota archaeon]|nr:HAD-IIIA family hydrolase [Nanoarchaeota archaeon]
MGMQHYHLNVKGDKFFKIVDGEEVRVDYSLKNSERIALIDRDGVIVEKPERHKYWHSPSDMNVLPGVPQAIKYLNDRNVPVMIITNQPGIYKKEFAIKDLVEMNEVIQRSISKNGAHIDGVIFCPHGKASETEGCTCRKPSPGMVISGMGLYHTPEEKTYVFGDFASDIGAAVNAGVNPIWVATKHDEYEIMREQISEKYPDVFKKAQFNDLYAAVKAVIV